MKIPLLLFLSILLSGLRAVYADTPLTAKVDKRVELLGIVARLAEYPEYCRNDNASYIADIRAHFDRYKTHPLIELMRRLKKENSIGYDAVVRMALHLGQPPDLKPIVPFTNRIPEERWSKENAEKFVDLLRQFYAETRCGDFFDSQHTRYEHAEKAYNKQLRHIDLKWFPAYYGINSEDTFHLIVGLGNGSNCYGLSIDRPDRTRDIFSIMGAWMFDADGNPVFTPEMLPTVVHEFGHSFANAHIRRHENDLGEAAGRIFGQVSEAMKWQAYANSTIMLSESLVRVSVIRYLLNHGDTTAATRQVKQDIAQGFLWMSKLSRLLTTYEKQRNAYPTMESFMPRIVEFFNNTADQIDRWPRFVSIEEFENGDNQVDPDLKTLTIRFDRPMSGGYGFGYGPLGQEHFPLKKVNGYPNDRTITIDTALKPKFEYQINLLSIGFFSTEGWPIKNTLIRFKTGSGK